jgi:hypothetical protein
MNIGQIEGAITDIKPCHDKNPNRRDDASAQKSSAKT